MPKKPSTILVMQDYRSLSSRRWLKLTVCGVRRPSKGEIRLELSVLEEPQQVGRALMHHLPAILAPHSPLCKFLAEGFDIRLAENEPFDLATLVGRVLEVRFTKARPGCPQTIAAVRVCEQPNEDQHIMPATPATHDQEAPGGLG